MRRFLFLLKLFCFFFSFRRNFALFFGSVFAFFNRRAFTFLIFYWLFFFRSLLYLSVKSLETRSPPETTSFTSDKS